MNFENILQFLTALKANNNREWMAAHKKEYELAKKDFENIVSVLIEKLSVLDPGIQGLTPKDCIFRIHRDIRFSKDKTPYKPNFGAAINKGGKKSSNATYYLHVEPGAPFLAGGMYMPPGEILKKIRQEVDYNAGEFRKIIEAQEFVKYFQGITGEKLKTSPQGYSADNPNIDLLRFKSYIVMHRMTDKDLTGNDNQQKIMAVYAALKPFNDFLNRSLD